MSQRLIKAAWEDFATQISVGLGQLVPIVANGLAKIRTVPLGVSILHRKNKNKIVNNFCGLINLQLINPMLSQTQCEFCFYFCL